MTYYAYFNRARAKRIERLRFDLARLSEIEAGLAREREALERLEGENRAAIAALEAQREERRLFLTKLGDDLQRQETRLARLRDDERALTELLASLSRELADIPLKLEEDRPFSAQRGRLPWPVTGRVRHRFGTPRGEGDLTWQGVVITAPAGAPVTAVSRGRVAFADWLRGFGLLLILDHGDGYMSLYGYNQTLLKDVGDWVSTGEKIAHVGDSGGRQDVGLYFEIRHRGTPRNPARWMISKAMTSKG